MTRRPLTITRAELARRVERAEGMAAVAVVGPESRDNSRAVTIVVSQTEESLRRLLRDAQRWNEPEMRLWALYWTSGREIAERIRTSIEEAFDGHELRSRGPWFRADPLAIELVMAGVVMAEGEHVFDGDEHRRRLERAIERALGRGRAA